MDEYIARPGETDRHPHKTHIPFKRRRRRRKLCPQIKQLINQSPIGSNLIPCPVKSTLFSGPIPLSAVSPVQNSKCEPFVIDQIPTLFVSTQEFAETAMNELLGWYGYGTEHAKRHSAQPEEAQGRAASASGASLAKKDLISPRNREPRGSSSSSRGNEQRAVSPPSLSNSPPPPTTTTLRASPGVSADNNLGK